MGLFSKLIGRKSTLPEPNDKRDKMALAVSKRAHDRYSILEIGTVSVLLDNGLSGSAHNISYGGIALTLKGKVVPLSLPTHINGKLTVLDQSIACKFKVCRTMHTQHGELFTALTTIHESPQTLIFLREFIEPYRMGSTLMAIDPRLLKERFKDGDWYAFRGEGPTDLLVRLDASRSLLEALVSFRVAERYLEIRYKDGKVQTSFASQSESPLCVGASMNQTATLDKDIIRTGLVILLASPPELRATLTSLTNALLQELGLAGQNAA